MLRKKEHLRIQNAVYSASEKLLRLPVIQNRIHGLYRNYETNALSTATSTPAEIMDEISPVTPSFGGISHARLDSEK